MNRRPGADRQRLASLALGDGERRGQVVRRRPDVQEVVPAPVGPDASGPLVVRDGQQPVVDAADGGGGPAGGQIREDGRLDELHTDEVGGRAEAGPHEAAHAAVARDEHAAVAVRGRMGGDGEGDRGAGGRVGLGERAKREGRQGVAVDDEEARAEQRQRLPRTAGGTEDDRLPGVAHVHAGSLPVAHQPCDRLRPVVQVEDDFRDALGRQPFQDAGHERPPGDRHRRFRADVGQGAETRSESGREYEGGRQRAGHRVGHYSKTMSPTGRPRAAQSDSHTRR